MLEEKVEDKKSNLVKLPSFLFEIGLTPLIFVNSLIDFEQKVGNSYTNQGEANKIILFLENLIKLMQINKKFLSIAIISPYKAQVELFYNLLNQNSYLKDSVTKVTKKISQNSNIIHLITSKRNEFKDSQKKINSNDIPPNLIEINSIDGFQGREKDIVIFSSVRSSSDSSNSSIGFLNDLRRLNVAITRSKKSLILFGNSLTLSKNSTFKEMIDCFKFGPKLLNQNDKDSKERFNSDSGIYNYENKNSNQFFDLKWTQYIETEEFEKKFIKKNSSTSI